MDRDTAREEIRRKYDCTRMLEKSKYGNYICPFCGSGTGAGQTGALKYNREANNCYCFACEGTGTKKAKGNGQQPGGGKTFDAIDLYMKTRGKDYISSLSEMAQELGITIDEPSERAHRLAGSQRRRENESGGIIEHDAQSGLKTPQNGAERAQDAAEDFSAYYEACAERLTDPQAVAYLNRRGISVDTAKSCGIGFDPASDPANAPGAMGDEGKKSPCPRLIIPSSAAHYVGRRTDGIKEYAKLNARGSKPGIFNGQAITHEVQKVFVCEGAFDALSVMEAGGAAIALNSANNGAALLDLLAEMGTAAVFILCPDNDPDEGTAEKVRGRFEGLADELRGKGFSCSIADINGSHKDANEYLTEDRSGFMNTIHGIMNGHGLEEVEPAKDAEKGTEERGSLPNTAETIDFFLAHGRFDAPKTKIETGFANIDAKLGGLYEGLYVLSAAPSIGKTTFALQLADQIAERGTDCIFFAFEQSAIELVSKSIARFGAIQSGSSYTGPTSLEIREEETTDAIRSAAEKYKAAVSNRMHIIAGDSSCNVLSISNKVRSFIDSHGGRPVVFIDYLQIIPRTDEAKRQDMRGNVDLTVTELRRLAREYHITVFVISSVSRESYLTPSTLDGFKESGGIEYSADAAFSMNLACAEEIKDKDGKIETAQKIQKAKEENPRKIVITGLKGRYTKAGTQFRFDYFPEVDLFREGGGGKQYTGWENAQRM